MVIDGDGQTIVFPEDYQANSFFLRRVVCIREDLPQSFTTVHDLRSLATRTLIFAHVATRERCFLDLLHFDVTIRTRRFTHISNLIAD